jgi:hypothetical protein
MDFEKDLIEGFKNQSITDLTKGTEEKSLPSIMDSKEWKMNKVAIAPDQVIGRMWSTKH